jgi:5-deoxy-glucuronate isomerase
MDFVYRACMLSETLFRVPRREGVHLIQRRGERGACELTTHRVTLAPGQSAAFVAPGEETVAVLQFGTGVFAADGHTWDVTRDGDVFDARATALLVPPGVELRIDADTRLEAVLVSTPAPGGGEAILRKPEDIVVQTRGRDGYVRDVHNIFVGDPHARRIVVGETINAPGNWSSYPPHKHDGRNGEPVFEEVYYYRLAPPSGFGLQSLYTSDGEAVTHQVRDGDLVLLPYGYHPVCAPPGHTIYYLWAIAGERRELAVFEDPDFRWVQGGR